MHPCYRLGRLQCLRWQRPTVFHIFHIWCVHSVNCILYYAYDIISQSSGLYFSCLWFLTLKGFNGYEIFMARCLFQLLSKGLVFRSGSQTGSPSTQKQLSITIDSVLAQKLAPNARIVVWNITGRGEIVSDSLDFTVNGAFVNEVKHCILSDHK